MTNNKQELIKEIKEIAGEYEYLVVDDYYTENATIWGSNADEDNIKKGGGKAAIILTEEILTDNILMRSEWSITKSEDGYYNTIDELADDVLDYFYK